MAPAPIASLGVYLIQMALWATLDLAFSPIVHVLIDFTQATVTGYPFLTSTAALHFQLLDADALHCSESLGEIRRTVPAVAQRHEHYVAQWPIGI
jgi:hypothetical protein